MLGAMRYLILALVLAATPALARDGDHDRARSAVRSGEALPLRVMLDRVAADFPGELIETELEEEHGRLIYEFKLVTPEGNVVELEYDARDGRLLRAKGKGGRR